MKGCGQTCLREGQADCGRPVLVETMLGLGPAHLSDNERKFFVYLFLKKLKSPSYDYNILRNEIFNYYIYVLSVLKLLHIHLCQSQK
jgi:hypothetical protein